MKRLGFGFALCLVLTIFLSGTSIAAEVWFSKANKLASVAVTDDGIQFIVTKSRAVDSCSGDDEFIVPNAAANFNLKAAAVLTASASKKKVNVLYDDADACPAEAIQIELEK